MVYGYTNKPVLGGLLVAGVLVYAAWLYHQNHTTICLTSLDVAVVCVVSGVQPDGLWCNGLWFMIVHHFGRRKFDVAENDVAGSSVSHS